MNRDSLADRLRPYSQDHALRWWSQLDSRQQQELAAQLAALDLDWLQNQQTPSAASGDESAADQARRAGPPEDLVRLPVSAADREAWAQAREAGLELLKGGRVGAILVAGGEATRLGYAYPKGMYPIGVVSNKSLFELLTEQLRARAARAGAAIPCYVMTSSATHEQTVAYFNERGSLGLVPADVHFFQQGNLPAVDRHTGKLLLAEKHQLALNPDGHGGLLDALGNAGLLDDMRRRGVDYLFYFQVDNPLVKVCDPAFLGFHALRDAEVSTKVVAKLSAEEKMGVAVSVDGRAQIIEYSDLPAERAQERNERGELKYWAGNTAIHVFSRAFLDRLNHDRIELPVHRAIKKVPCLDDTGRRVNPDTENAVKYERFIFDVLPLAKRALVVEASRDEEFCPLKNRTGDFSPPHVQQSLQALHGNWLRGAGIAVAPGLPVEIAPLYALDADELAARVDPSMTCNGPVHLEA
jgi:UDP-N-acetylglucosamine/UDP-N-acetylgalactosamine diphosphorylase